MATQRLSFSIFLFSLTFCSCFRGFCLQSLPKRFSWPCNYISVRFGWMRLVVWELLTSSKSTWMYMYRHDSACKLHSCTVIQWWALHKTTTVWLFEVVSCALENSSAYQHYFEDSYFFFIASFPFFLFLQFGFSFPAWVSDLDMLCMAMTWS